MAKVTKELFRKSISNEIAKVTKELFRYSISNGVRNG